MYENELQMYKNKIKKLNKIGVLISKEKDVGKLMNMILEEGLNLTSSDAGSIYFREEIDGQELLLFKCAINKSNDFEYVGKTIILNHDSVSGHATLSGETVVLNQDDENNSFKIDKSFDNETNYTTVNMIVVPMLNEIDKVVGVFQIMNKKDEQGNVVAYNMDDIDMISSLASQCAIIIDRIRLNEKLKRNVNLTRTTLIKFFNGMKLAMNVIGDDILKEQDEFKEFATLDNLTGLFTRNEGLAFLKKQFEFAQLNSIKIVLAFIDVNDLKKVNDKYGHKEGDILIKTVVDLISNVSREGDFMLRYGGDEFLLCIFNSDLKSAAHMKRRIDNKFIDYNKNSNKDYNVQASFGFAEYNNIDNPSIDTLIELADKNMYIDKMRIKNSRK